MSGVNDMVTWPPSAETYEKARTITARHKPRRIPKRLRSMGLWTAAEIEEATGITVDEVAELGSIGALRLADPSRQDLFVKNDILNILGVRMALPGDTLASYLSRCKRAGVPPEAVKDNSWYRYSCDEETQIQAAYRLGWQDRNRQADGDRIVAAFRVLEEFRYGVEDLVTLLIEQVVDLDYGIRSEEELMEFCQANLDNGVVEDIHEYLLERLSEAEAEAEAEGEETPTVTEDAAVQATA
jgi:hypothetical protein